MPTAIGLSFIGKAPYVGPMRWLAGSQLNKGNAGHHCSVHVPRGFQSSAARRTPAVNDCGEMQGDSRIHPRPTVRRAPPTE
jgi:hypothetical protein